MSAMIETDGLSRYFGTFCAVRNISFEVKKGEVLGFLGPNGAGKSTTMKMLTCFLAPTDGTARIAGYDIVSQQREVRESLGYLPENAPLYGEMNVEGFLRFVAELRGIAGAELSSSIGRVLELTALEEVRKQRIETLSKGFKRRVGLAQALIHDPEILILDEPTDGLDPNQKHDVRRLINQMASEKCIILSTHILEEVEEVCNRVVIIAKGELVADSSPEELKRQSQSHGAVTVVFREAEPESALHDMKRIDGVRDITREELFGGRVRYTVYPQNGSVILPKLADKVAQEKWSVDSVRLESGQLDEVFREITA